MSKNSSTFLSIDELNATLPENQPQPIDLHPFTADADNTIPTFDLNQQLQPNLPQSSLAQHNFDEPYIATQIARQNKREQWKAQQTQNLNEALLNYDAYAAKRAKQGIDIYFNDAPNPQQERENAILQAKMELDEEDKSTFQPLGELGLQLYRDKIAQRDYAGKGVGSTADFIAAMRDSAQTEKDRTEFASERRKYAVFALTDPDKYNSKTWAEKATTLKGYIAENTATDNADFRRDLLEAQQELSPVLDYLQDIWRGFKKGENISAIAEEAYTNLDPKNREKLIAGIALRANSMPAKERDAFLARTTESISRQFSASNTALKDARNLSSHSLLKTATLLANSSIEGGWGEANNPDEQRKLDQTLKDANALYTQDRNTINFRDAILSIRDESYDPLKSLYKENEKHWYNSPARAGEWLIDHTPTLLADVGVATIASIGTGNPYTGIAIMAAKVGVQATEENRKTQFREQYQRTGDLEQASEMSDNWTNPAKGAVAGATAAINLSFFSRIPMLNTALKSIIASFGGKAGLAITEGIKELATNAVITEAQHSAEYGIDALAKKIGTEIPDFNQSMFQGFWTRQSEAAATMLPLAIIGGIAHTREARNLKPIADAPIDTLLALGYSQESAEKIKSSRNVVELKQILNDANKSRNPYSESAQLATNRILEAQQKQKQGIQTFQALGEIPLITALKSGKFSIDNSATGEHIGIAATPADALKAAATYSDAAATRIDAEYDRYHTLLEAASESSARSPEAETKTIIELNNDQKQFTFSEDTNPETLTHEARQAFEQIQAMGLLSQEPTTFTAFGKSQTEFLNNVRHTTNRILAGSDALTVLHEEAHGLRRQAERDGSVTRAEQIYALQAIDNAIAESAYNRGTTIPKDAFFLPENFDSLTPEQQDTALDEGFSLLIESEAIRNRKNSPSHQPNQGEKTNWKQRYQSHLGFTGNLLTRNLIASIKATIPSTAKFFNFLRATKQYLGLSLKRATLTKQAIRDGIITHAQLHDFTAKITGLKEADIHNRAADTVTQQLLDPSHTGPLTPSEQPTPPQEKPAYKLKPVQSESDIFTQYQGTPLERAKQYLKEHVVGKKLTNKSGLEAELSNNNVGKIASGKALAKSSSPLAHMLAIRDIRELFEQSTTSEIQPDRDNNPNIQGIIRTRATAEINGSRYEVKFTVKDFSHNQGTRIYSLESIEKENASAGQHGADPNELSRTSPLTEAQDQSNPTSPESQTSFSILPAKILIDGEERHTSNSEGKPIADTEEGVRNFYNWFGGSEVVDSDGKPLVVYHNTNSDFNTFKQGGNGLIQFTPDKELFSSKGDRKIPAYLTGEIKRNRTGKILSVFDPNQIKSATDNRGTFDPTNPDIRFSLKKSPYGIAKEGHEPLDWNTLARPQFEQAKTTSITGKEIFPNGIPEGSNITNLKPAILEYAVEHSIIGDHDTPALKDKVRISWGKIKGAISHGAWNDKIYTVAALPDLLKHAVWIQSEKSTEPKDQSKHHILASKLKLDGKEHTVSLIVREEENKFYYDHELTSLGNGEGFEQSNIDPESQSGSTLEAAKPSVSKLMQNALFVNNHFSFSLKRADLTRSAYHAIERAAQLADHNGIDHIYKKIHTTIKDLTATIEASKSNTELTTKTKADLKAQAKQRALEHFQQREEELLHRYQGNSVKDITLEARLKEKPIHSHLQNGNTLTGRLMSKSKAIREGKYDPTKNGDYDGAAGITKTLFGGHLMPDQAAQELHDAGLLPDAHPDTLWEALHAERSSSQKSKQLAKDYAKQLRDARQEAKQLRDAWLKEQTALYQASPAKRQAALRTTAQIIQGITNALPESVANKIFNHTEFAAIQTPEKAAKYLEKTIDRIHPALTEAQKNLNHELMKSVLHARIVDAQHQKELETQKSQAEKEIAKLHKKLEQAKQQENENLTTLTLALELEKHLQAKEQNLADITALLEKSQPIHANEGGKVIKGKIGVQTHRLFATAERAFAMNEHELAAAHAELTDRETKLQEESSNDIADPRLLEIANERRMLDLTGDWENKTPAEQLKAIQALDRIYRYGRDEWQHQEAERHLQNASLTRLALETLAGMQGVTLPKLELPELPDSALTGKSLTEQETILAAHEKNVANIIKNHKATIEQTLDAKGITSRDARTTKQRADDESLLKATAKGVSGSMASFVQVLERAFGKDHPIVIRWNEMGRQAQNQRADANFAHQEKFHTAMRNILDPEGKKSRSDFETDLYDLAYQQTIEVQRHPERATENTIPIDIARKLKDGTIQPHEWTFANDTEKQTILKSLEAHDARPDGERGKSQTKNLTYLREDSITSPLPPSEKLTTMEAISILLYADQNQYQGNLDKMGYTQPVLDTIREQIGTKGNAIKDFFQQQYREGYDTLNDTYKSIYGVDMPQIENYAPTSVEKNGKTELATSPLDSSLGGTGNAQSSFLKSRQQHNHELAIRNAANVFTAHNAKSEHWRAFVSMARELRAVLENKQVKHAMETTHGKYMPELLHKWIEIIENDGIKQSELAFGTDGLIKKIQNNTALTALALRVTAIAKNAILPATSSMRIIGMNAWLTGLAKASTGQLDYSALLHSDFIQRRNREGNFIEMRAALADLASKKPNLQRHLSEKSIRLMQTADTRATALSAAIAYDHYLNSAKKSGMSPDAAHQHALLLTEDTVRRTAQPNNLLEKSAFEHNLPAIGKVLFMFCSEPRMAAAHVMEAIYHNQDGLKGIITNPTLRNTFTTMIVGAMLEQLIQNSISSATSKNSEDYWDDKRWGWKNIALGLATQPLSGLPFIGDAASAYSGRGFFDPLHGGSTALQNIWDTATDEDDHALRDEPLNYLRQNGVKLFRAAALLSSKTADFAAFANGTDQMLRLVDNMWDNEAQAARKQRKELKERREKTSAQ